MNLLGLEYTLKYKSLDIYLAGCGRSPRCAGCHNPEGWSFTAGAPIDEVVLVKILKQIEHAGELIRNIFILGGEPLDQPLDQLEALLDWLTTFERPIWLFSGKTWDEIGAGCKEAIFPYLSYLKCGDYREDLRSDDHVCYGIELASTNQIIYKLDSRGGRFE